jgi:hypothetical protein
MKIGITIKIDVTKIDKSRLFKGEKGTYLDLTTFIDTENQDQYGNNGFISQSITKEEREQKVQTPILGNAKVFFSDSASPQAQNRAPKRQQSAPPPPPMDDDFDDDIPF